MSAAPINSHCNGRDLALSALLLVDKGFSAQEALNQAIGEAGRAQDIPDRERALAGELLYGCLRAETRIRFLLNHVLPRPEKLPPQFLHILALAVYSLLFQDSVPDRAAIHTAVEMAGRSFGKGLRGLANGALRSIQRLGADLDNPDFYIRGQVNNADRGRKNGKAVNGGADARWHGLATYHGLPPFIAELWRTAYGEDNALALMRRSAARPWTGIRVNPAHPKAGEILRQLLRSNPEETEQNTDCGAESEQSRELAFCKLTDKVSIPEIWPEVLLCQAAMTAKDPEPDHNVMSSNGMDDRKPCMDRLARIGKYGLAFAPGCLPKVVLGHSLDHWQAVGAISFQSAGSQLVLQELGILPEGLPSRQWQSAPVWDACAGVGGKSLTLLEQGINVALATDSSRRRLAILPRQCARLGITSPPVALARAEQPPMRAWAGNILLDVPCSGLGVLARRPDLRRRFTGKAAGQHLHGLVQSQAIILEKAASLLEKGAQLAYITCTLDPEENAGAIQKLLASHPSLSLIREWQTDHDHPWLEGMYGALIG